MQRLSVTIITKNEARHIVDCIRSARFADEVVVVDCGSTDGTVALAEAEGARVVVTDWPGDGAQKNRAIDLATGDWFFSLDADERIPEALAREVRAAIERENMDAFQVPRLSSYCGQFMHHGGWRPDYNWRLARRGKARWTETQVHSVMKVHGRSGRLRESIIHYSFPDMESVLEKVNRYSSWGAADQHAAGRRASLRKAVGHGIWAFIRTYFLRRGFLDGRMGFLLAVSNAEGTYYRYVKLWLRQRPPARTGEPRA